MLVNNIKWNDINTEDQENCLLVHRLPCAEDIRDYLFPSLVAFHPTALQGPGGAVRRTQQAAVSSLVDSMTLQTVGITTLCPVNPVLFNLYNSVRDKITGACSTEINASMAMKDPICSPFLGAAETATALAKVYNNFTLEKLESSKKKRKTYWSEIEVKTGGGGTGMIAGAESAGAGAAKIARSEDASSVGGSSFASGETDVESVFGSSLEDAPDFTAGSVAPVEDFQTVVSFAADPVLKVGAEQRQGLIKSAMQTLMDIVERHVTLGASAAYYKRAVACIGALRKVAAEHGEYNFFNTYLRDKVKLPHQFGRHSALWKLLLDENLSLISNREVPDCAVTPADADAFLHAKAEVSASAPVVQATEEEDDLFGSMA